MIKTTTSSEQLSQSVAKASWIFMGRAKENVNIYYHDVNKIIFFFVKRFLIVEVIKIFSTNCQRSNDIIRPLLVKELDQYQTAFPDFSITLLFKVIQNLINRILSEY